MVISDRRHGVQVRSAHDHRLHVFDDLGCALLWLETLAPDASSPEELWVRDPAGEAWIDGLVARYSSGHGTPMNYGFATAEDQAVAATDDLGEVRRRVLEREHGRAAGGR